MSNSKSLRKKTIAIERSERKRCYQECETIYGGTNLVLFNRISSFRAIKLHGSSQHLPL